MELCRAVQPDGGGQRCIRFEGHEGPHQTFVAEWSNGEQVSRRRQAPAQAKPPAATPNRSRQGGPRQQRPRSGGTQQQPPRHGGKRRSRNRKKH